MKDNSIDQLFKNNLAQHEQNPSPDIWDQIEGKLDGKKGKVVNWKWLTGMAASIAIALVSFGLFERSNQSEIEKIVNKEAKGNGVIELTNEKINQLVENAQSDRNANVVILNKDDVDSNKRVNMNFLKNSPKKDQEVQYYAEKEADSILRNFELPLLPYNSGRNNNNSRTVSGQ